MFQVSQFSQSVIYHTCTSNTQWSLFFLFSVFLSLCLTRVFVVCGPSWNGPGRGVALLLNFLATWCLNHTGRGLTVTALLSFFSHSFFHFFSSSSMQNSNIDTYSNLWKSKIVLMGAFCCGKLCMKKSWVNF